MTMIVMMDHSDMECVSMGSGYTMAAPPDALTASASLNRVTVSLQLYHVNNFPAALFKLTSALISKWTCFAVPMHPDGSGQESFLNIAQSESSCISPLCVLTWRRQPPCCFASLSAERSGDSSGAAVSLWFTFTPGPYGPATSSGLRQDTRPFVLDQPLLWRQGRCEWTSRLASVSCEANWTELSLTVLFSLCEAENLQVQMTAWLMFTLPVRVVTLRYMLTFCVTGGAEVMWWVSSSYWLSLLIDCKQRKLQCYRSRVNYQHTCFLYTFEIFFIFLSSDLVPKPSDAGQ